MQSIHSTTEEFVSVTTFSVEEAPHKVIANGGEGESDKADVPQGSDIYEFDDPEPDVLMSKQINGKGKKEKRRNKGGPKSKKARASKKKHRESPEDDEQSLDLHLDDETSEINDSVDQNTDVENEPVHNGTNGHKDDRAINITDDAMGEGKQAGFAHFIGEDRVNKDVDKLMLHEEIIKDKPVVYDDTIGDEEIILEMDEDFGMDVDEEDRSLAELVADHKMRHGSSQPIIEVANPLVDKVNTSESDKGQSPSSDDSFTTAPGPSTQHESQSTNQGRDPELTGDVLKTPFVRYLTTVSARPPLHSSLTEPGASQFDGKSKVPPPESPRGMFRFFGLASKQCYTVNDSPPCPSLGKRKAESPVPAGEEKILKKLKPEDNSPGFFSRFGRFRSFGGRSSTPLKEDTGDLVLEAGEVGDISGEGLGVDGVEEMPALQRAEEPSKWCSVM